MVQLTDIAFGQDHPDLKELIKEKVMKANSHLKLNNHKIGSKALEDLLAKRFGVTKDEQVEYSE